MDNFDDELRRMSQNFLRRHENSGSRLRKPQSEPISDLRNWGSRSRARRKNCWPSRLSPS